MAEQKQPDDNHSDRPESSPEHNGRGSKGQKTPPNPKMSRGTMGWMFLAGLAVLTVIFVTNAQNSAKDISPEEFLNKAKSGDFKKIIIKDKSVIGIVKADTAGESADQLGPSQYRFIITPYVQEYFLKEIRKLSTNYEIKSDDGSILMPVLLYWGPFILLAFLFYFFVIRRLSSAGGGPGMLGNFGRSRHRVTNKEHSTVTLDDVAGIDEAKEEVAEIIEFLRNPKSFQRLGGRVPRGVLLIGDPGCGKTLLAKAVAGEAEVPFFSISGSDFVEMFVGVGASRVRDLFKQAKDSAPCIIFLDEIDAVGRRRGNGMSSGGHDEREQTLNAILVEMDGFETSDQVIVVAATNRSDVLDPALTRPGRFDRQIHVSLPDVAGRAEILKVHGRGIKMSPDVDLERLARGTPMFSGADLAAIVNEAAIAATLQGKDLVEQDDFEEARDKVKWGRARKSHKIDEQEKKVIAYHEAGHALVTYCDEDAEPLHKVTIIPRGQALGLTFMLPEKDRHIWGRKNLLAQLRITFGGRISEDMFCDDISSGAAQDIRQATTIARAMITEFGMSDKIGFQLLGLDESRNPWEQPEKLYSEETAHLIDEEVRALINRTYNETKLLLTEHRDQLDRVAQALLKYETLSRDQVDRIMKGEELPKSTVGDLLHAEKQKRDAQAEPAQTDAEEPVIGDDPTGALPSPA